MPLILDNEISQQIQDLALKHRRSPIEQLISMIEISEILDIQRVSYLTGPAGAELIPVYEVNGPIVQDRSIGSPRWTISSDSLTLGIKR